MIDIYTDLYDLKILYNKTKWWEETYHKTKKSRCIMI